MENPKIFSQAYYELLHQAEERHWWCRGTREIAGALLESPLLEAGSAKKEWSALDAGCGTGYVLRWLRDLGVGGPVLGFDLSAHALSFCRSRGERGLCLASATDLPYRDRQFNLIACFDVLQHLPRPDGDVRALREFHRVLKPGGYAVIRANARRAVDAGEGDELDYQRYTVESLRAAFAAAGLEAVRVSYINSFDAWREGLGFQRRAGSREVKNQSDHGLPLRLLPPWLAWLGAARLQLLRAEARRLRRPGAEIARGHSTVALLRRG